MSNYYELDAKRLLCPLPVIRTQNKMKELKPGDVLKVICTDPGALQDIPAWCRIYGHSILRAEMVGKEIVIEIMRSQSEKQ